MSNTAVIQLQQRETFEQNVTRALVAGAGAGVLAFVMQRLNVPIPLSFLALVGTSLACVRGDKMDRLLLAALSVALPALPWILGLSAAWSVGLAGAAVGILMVKSRLTEKGEEGSLGAARPGNFHFAATAGVTAGMALAGTEVARILASRLSDLAAPLLLNYAAAGTSIALFVGLGSITAHLALKGDPVEARVEEVMSQVSGDFEAQMARVLSLYRQCGASLAALPREAAREELARTVQKMTRDAAELASEWAGVESHLHDDAHKDLVAEIADLKKSAAEGKDPVAKRQLELAASSLEEELVRLGEMKLKRERIMARIKSQTALLERARVALIGMRSSHASVRAAEMSAVARKLSALATSQSDEARLAHAVATSAELDAAEAQAGDEKLRKQVSSVKAEAQIPAPEAPAPVAEVSAPAEGEAKAASEAEKA